MRRKIPWWAIAFIIAQLVLYVGIFAIGEDIIRYLVVVLSFCFSLIFISKSKDSYLTVGALALTLAADTCLVLMHPRQQLVGMIFFSIAQLIYACRIHFLFRGRARAFSVALRLCAVLLVEGIAICVTGEAFDALAAVSMFYFTNIVINAVFSLMHLRSQTLLSIGMLLFVICDIFVGLNCSVGIYFSVPESSILYWLAHPPIDAVWLFYAPSQTLIALSSVRDGSFIKNIKRR